MCKPLVQRGENDRRLKGPWSGTRGGRPAPGCVTKTSVGRKGASEKSEIEGFGPVSSWCLLASRVTCLASKTGRNRAPLVGGSGPARGRVLGLDTLFPPGRRVGGNGSTSRVPSAGGERGGPPGLPRCPVTWFPSRVSFDRVLVFVERARSFFFFFSCLSSTG